jgi:osmotically-inducible protein OsmY
MTIRLKTIVLSSVFVFSQLQGCAALIGASAVTGASVAIDRRTAGTMLDDQIIEFKILDMVRADDELWQQTHLNATSLNNIVLLTGEAPVDELRSRVETLVHQIPKVRRVHNEMVIAAPSSVLSRSSDSWITSKVKTNLLSWGLEEASRIKVVTENGSVYLMGLVTQDEAETATELSRGVSGVQRVVKVFEYLD